MKSAPRVLPNATTRTDALAVADHPARVRGRAGAGNGVAAPAENPGGVDPTTARVPGPDVSPGAREDLAPGASALGVLFPGEPHITLRLPVPPSANRMKERNAKTGQHYRTKAYTTWLRDVAWTCAIQRAGDAIQRHYAIAIIARKARKDLGNLEKPTQDGLREARVIADDRYCLAILLANDETRDPDTMLVHLWSLPEPARAKRGKKVALTRAMAEPLKRS